MGLFEPVWMTDNYKKCSKAVEYVRKKIGSDADRLKIIRQARLSEVKSAAMDGLSDLSLIDVDTYFSLPDYLRKKVVESITDEGFLAAIVRADDHAPNRLAALKKTSDEGLGLEALKDPNDEVKAEAVFHIRDNDVLARYISNYGCIDHKRMDDVRAIIDGFSREQLEMLLEGRVRDAAGDIIHHACARLGHRPGKNCRCSVCKARLPHVFDGDGVCRNCGAKRSNQRESLKIMGEKYGYRDNVILTYTDGTVETLERGREVVTADEATMKWLLTDD